MKTTDVSRAALGRIPVYLKFIESLPQDVETVSATTIAKALGFGEVQVRKDLGAICGSGKPRIGYTVSDLKASLECLIDSRNGKTVIVGAGKLGRALLDYGEFVVHVFQPETREYYRLEALWNDAPIIDLAKEAGLVDVEYSERIAKLLKEARSRIES